MAHVTAAGVPVLNGALTLPRQGAWHALLVLDTDEAPSGSITIDWGGRQWTGTIYASRVERGVSVVQAVGGAGGLKAKVTAQGFRDAKVSAVFDHIANASGEALSSNIDAALLARKFEWFPLLAGLAGRCLDTIAGVLGTAWRFEPDGKLWVGEEKWPKAAIDNADIELIDLEGPTDRVRVRMLDPSLMPGTVWDGLRVSRVEHTVAADDLSTLVWFER